MSRLENTSSAEEILIRSFQETQNPELLGRIFTPYMHLVYGVCLKYLKNREEAKDAVMQVFEKLYTEIPKHTILHFKPWLHVLTRNHCLMKLRSDKSHAEKEKKYQLDETTFMESEVFMHPIDEDQASLNQALLDCIEGLKEEQKACIQLFYFEEKSYQEIARMLKQEINKVKSHLQNGKRNLKLCLENNEQK